MNTFMKTMNQVNNFAYTENGALTHKTTGSKVLDLFGLGAAYRKRSDEDVILLFKNAYEEDPLLAMKCLFYLRDVRGGQGERHFFRTAYRWLCKNNYAVAEKNLEQIPEFGRWDDLIYITEGTGLEIPAFTLIKYQLFIDKQSKTPSLLGKWMPSQNASNKETKRLGHKLADFLGMTDREYRKTLSSLREKIKVLETLMSQNRWDEIEFDKIPSKAGLIYKNAFAHKEVTAARYKAFMESKTTKVNAGALYPYEIVAKAINRTTNWGWNYNNNDLSLIDRQALEKYWENLPDYFKDCPEQNMLCVVDTSGSMCGNEASAPINVAISLGMYAAERAGGPFKNCYISFSSRPQLINIEGVDFVDKVRRIYRTNLCENTDLVATFDMLLAIADRPDVKEEDVPNSIVVISDMEIDYGAFHRIGRAWTKDNMATEMEWVRQKWINHGHKPPRLTYWNVQARQNNILDLGPNVSYVSGMSPSIFTQIMTGKSGWDLMIETLMSDRYKTIKI